MAQSGYTPIQLYYSTTAAAVPTAGNLNSGELAINITDGKLYYKSNAGVVTLLAGSTGSGPAGGSNTQVQFNSSGLLAGSANFTWNGTVLTASTGANFATTSGSVGIGTSSPSYTLDLSSTTSGIIARFKSTSTYGQVVADNSSGTGGGLFVSKQNGTNTAIFGNSGGILGTTSTDVGIYGAVAGSSINFYNDDTPTLKMTLNSSGNLGLGVTPSAADNTLKYVTVGNVGNSFAGFNGNLSTYVLAGTYYNGGWKYAVTGSAVSRYDIGAGSHAWLTAPSGTAGNAVTFTQAMTLDASGNLMVGTTTATGKVNILQSASLTPGLVTDCLNAVGTIWHRFTSASGVNQYMDITLRSGTEVEFTTNSKDISLLSSSTFVVKSSGNVGIGTSSPSQTLSVSQTALITAPAGGVSQLLFGDNASDAAGRLFYNHGNDNLQIFVNSAERMRIDSSGNVGIGTSSPTNSASYTTLEVKGPSEGGMITANYNNSVYMKMFANSNNIGYVGTTSAHPTVFVTSGTERMRIDGSGNVIVGSTGAVDSAKFQIFGAKALSSGIPQQQLNIADTSAIAAGVGGAIAFSAQYLNGSYTTMGSIEGTRENATVGNYAGALIFRTRTTGSDNFERMRITSDGKVGIGTATPPQLLSISGASNPAVNVRNTAGPSSNFYSTTGEGVIGTDSGHAFAFHTSNTERMRLDTSGNLLVGRTSGTGAMIDAFNASSTSGVIRLRNDTGGAQVFANFDYGGAIIGSITGNNTVTAYNVTSDARVKTNIIDAPSGNINDIKVRSFDWVADGSHQEYGMIAQELLTVAPYAVYQPKDSKKMMGVDYSKLVPMMIKEIQDLKQRIATLENK